MKHISRRGWLAGVGFGLGGMGLGCGGANPFLLIPTLFSGGEAKTPAEFPLALHPKKKDAHVVVIVSAKMGLPPDLAGIDRMLNAEVIRILQLNAKASEERVLVLPMPKIDEYKAQAPNWKTIHPVEAGKAIVEGGDYVIDVEINEMDLFKPGSRGRWLLGSANVAVSVYDLTKPVHDPQYKQDLTVQYPMSGEVEVESRAQVSAFRMKFVERIASNIAVKFTATSQKKHDMD